MRNYTTYKTAKNPAKIDASLAPSVVLVRPQLGENIGAAARAMMNFGLSDLRIVSPRDGWPNPKALEMSAHAEFIVEEAKIFDDISDALADIHFAVAASARSRSLEMRQYDVRQAVTAMSGVKASGGNIAMVFGPENNGLSNDDIARCNAIVTIPTHPANPSLNLGQSVVVLAYQWFVDCGSRGLGEMGNNGSGGAGMGSSLATVEEVEGLYRHIESDLDRNGFYKTDEIRDVMRRNLRAMLGRVGLTSQEVRTLHGMVRFLGDRG